MLIPPKCRAVLFDAVGTLIHPVPAAGEVYAEAGRRFGSRLPVETVITRFQAAFRRQDELDRARGYRTDESREHQRWRSIVREVFVEMADPADCFTFLWDYFARPSAWRVEPRVGDTLSALDSRGLVLGVASNFDRRLRAVLASFAELTPL